MLLGIFLTLLAGLNPDKKQHSNSFGPFGISGLGEFSESYNFTLILAFAVAGILLVKSYEAPDFEVLKAGKLKLE